MNIRLANTSDTNRIFEIYEYARAYMKVHGNPWVMTGLKNLLQKTI